MKIVVNADSFQPLGGITFSTLQLSRSLAAAGHEITVLYRVDGPLRQEYLEFASALHRVPSFHLRQATPVGDAVRLPPAVLRVWRSDPDLVYLQRAEQLVWALAGSLGGLRRPAAPGLSRLRRHRTPVVVHLRHHPTGAGLATLCRGVDRFVAVSDYIRRDWVAAGVPEDRIAVVHNGIDPDEYPFGGTSERAAARQHLGLPPEAFVALYYGRIEPEKGMDCLLRAWKAVRAEREDAVLVVQGDSVVADEPERYLAELKAAAPEGVVWLPKSRDVVTPLHASDVAVLPALWGEPFGRVVIEGLSTGRPVVASRVGGIPEILTGRLARHLFEPDDAQELATRLLEVAGWQGREPDLGEACRRHVEDSFTLRQTSQAVDALLREVREARV